MVESFSTEQMACSCFDAAHKAGLLDLLHKLLLEARTMDS